MRSKARSKKLWQCSKNNWWINSFQSQLLLLSKPGLRPHFLRTASSDRSAFDTMAKLLDLSTKNKLFNLLIKLSCMKILCALGFFCSYDFCTIRLHIFCAPKVPRPSIRRNIWKKKNITITELQNRVNDMTLTCSVAKRQCQNINFRTQRLMAQL